MDVIARPLRLMALAACLGTPVLAAGASGIHGRIVDSSGLPLPGVTVELLPQPTGTPIVAVTDNTGVYLLDAPPGRYKLHVELSGFEPVTRPAVTPASPPAEIDLTLQLAKVQAEVTVLAHPHELVGSPGVGQPTVITRRLFNDAMLWNNEYSDALPLLPGVVRAPDGQISVAGARTAQGGLLVNGFNESDPVTGEPYTLVPLDAVASMQVYSGFYPADLGQAAAGVTTIDTRPGSDRYQFSTMGFLPRMRFGTGLFDGVDSWEPSIGFRGPVVKNRVWFAESLDYQYNHNQFETAVGSQENLFTSLTSLSQIDLQPTTNHHLSLAILNDPQTTDAAGITQFTPASTVPRLHQGGWSATGVDRLLFGSVTTVETRLAVSRTDDSTTSNGNAPYVVGHDVTTGSYFDTQSDSAYQVEAGSTVSRMVSGAVGQHLLKAGVMADYATTTGLDQSAPVDFLNSQGTVVQAVSFAGTAHLAATATETSAFLQDSWSVNHLLALDLGVRYDRSSAAVDGVVAPRVGWTLKLPDGRSTLSGGFGVFTDKVVLQTLTFSQLQPRVVQLYTAAGLPDGQARVFQNVFSGPLQMPRATGWSAEFDRTFKDGWLARVKYQDRNGTDEPIVTSENLTATTGLLALSSTGQSHAWSLETTIGYRSARSGDEVYVSYVRSASTGNLNDLNSIDGLFKTVFVQPDAIGPLAVDVPNRLLTWGVLQLPWKLGLAPFLEVRSGFPYTAINDTWNVVGVRNGMRYAPFASVNLAAYRVVHLSKRLPAARLGVQVFNIFSANNARDIQTDITSPAFGTTYNPMPRELDGYFELLWGKR